MTVCLKDRMKAVGPSKVLGSGKREMERGQG